MGNKQDFAPPKPLVPGDPTGLGSQIADNLCRYISLDALVLLRIYARTRLQQLPMKNFVTLAKNFGLELPHHRRLAVDSVVEDVVVGRSFLDAIRRVQRPDFDLVAEAISDAQSQKVTSFFYRAILDHQPPEKSMGLMYEDRSRKKLTRLLIKTFVIFNVLFFIMLFLVPELQKISQEYGIELPPAMQGLAAIDQFFLGLWLFTVPIVLGLMVWGVRNSDYLINRVTRKFSSWRWLQRPLTKNQRRKLSVGWVQALSSHRRQDNGKIELAAAKVSRQEAAAMQTADSELTRFWLINRIVEKLNSKSDLRKQRIVETFVLFWNLILMALVCLAAVAVVSFLTNIIETMATWK